MKFYFDIEVIIDPLRECSEVRYNLETERAVIFVKEKDDIEKVLRQLLEIKYVDCGVVDGWNTCKEIDCGCSESAK